METVIAKTKKGLLAAYIIILVCGAIIFLSGMAFILFAPLEEKFAGAYFLVLGGVFLGLGIGYTVYFARLPKNCITFKEGKMRLHTGFEFSPAEIDYCTGSTLWFDWGGFYRYGTLIISVKHQEYKYKFVADVEATASNIKALQAQFTAIAEVQRHIAEKKAAEARMGINADKAENKD
ncbi:MAG: hypothetical protein K2K38_03625 [Clostridia bacterium]|nr:hypothetical protein [Clostridia bacterium]